MMFGESICSWNKTIFFPTRRPKTKLIEFVQWSQCLNEWKRLGFFKQCSKSGLLKSPVAAKWRSMGPDHKDYQNKVYGVRPYQTDFLRSKHSPVFCAIRVKSAWHFHASVRFPRNETYLDFHGTPPYFKERWNDHNLIQEDVPRMYNRCGDQQDFSLSFLTLLLARSTSCCFSLASVWSCCSCARRSCSSCLRKASSQTFNLSTAELSVLKEEKVVWLQKKGNNKDIGWQPG